MTSLTPHAAAVTTAMDLEALCRPSLFTPQEWAQLVRAFPLSRRQSEIVGLIMQGKSDKQIESLLSVKRTTIRSHFMDIQTRLGVTTRIEIVCWVFALFRRISEAPPHK